MPRVYRKYETAARAHAGPRAAARVKDWYKYSLRLIRKGEMRASTPAEHWPKGWSSGWVLEKKQVPSPTRPRDSLTKRATGRGARS
jgi:hypothetical protein